MLLTPIRTKLVNAAARLATAKIATSAVLAQEPSTSVELESMTSCSSATHHRGTLLWSRRDTAKSLFAARDSWVAVRQSRRPRRTATPQAKVLAHTAPRMPHRGTKRNTAASDRAGTETAITRLAA